MPEIDEEELFHQIVRATTNVPPERIAQAVATVRALFAQAAPVERAERKSRDRIERSGQDRSE